MKTGVRTVCFLLAVAVALAASQPANAGVTDRWGVDLYWINASGATTTTTCYVDYWFYDYPTRNNGAGNSWNVSVNGVYDRMIIQGWRYTGMSRMYFVSATVW